MADDVELPRWQWDDKLGALVPLCPVCGGTAKVSGLSLICLMMANSHYNERLNQVLDETQRRLAEPRRAAPTPLLHRVGAGLSGRTMAAWPVQALGRRPRPHQGGVPDGDAAPIRGPCPR